MLEIIGYLLLASIIYLMSVVVSALLFIAASGLSKGNLDLNEIDKFLFVPILNTIAPIILIIKYLSRIRIIRPTFIEFPKYVIKTFIKLIKL